MKNKDLLGEAIKEIEFLITQALAAGDISADVAVLSTASADGQPSARVVYVHICKPIGFAFFVNQNSGKAQQIAENPRVCLAYNWPNFEQQIIIEGVVEALPAEEADRLWAKRPRTSHVAAWAFAQEAKAPDKRAHPELKAQVKQQFPDGRIPKPDNWAGHLLRPHRITLWPSGWHRMRPRTVYSKTAGGEWEVVKMQS